MLRIRHVAAGSMLPAVLLIAFSLPSLSLAEFSQGLSYSIEANIREAERIEKCRQILSEENIGDIKSNINNIYDQAVEQEVKGNYQSAIDLYSRVESVMEVKSLVTSLLHCEHHRYMTADRDSHAKKMIKVTSLSAVRRGLGRSYSLLCMNERAIDMFQTESDDAIESTLNSLELASLYIALKKYDKAVREYQKLINRFQNDVMDSHFGTCEDCSGVFEFYAYRVLLDDFDSRDIFSYNNFILWPEIYLRYGEALRLAGMDSLANYINRKAKALQVAHVFSKTDMQKINPEGWRYHDIVTKRNPCKTVKEK